MPGAMFTASHNPAAYNGIKFCRAGAVPVSLETGLVPGPRRRGRRSWTAPDPRAGRHPGTITQRSLVTEYAAFLSLAGRPDRGPAAEGRGRRRQRDGRADRAGGVRRGCRSTSFRCTSSWTAASRTTRRTRSTRRTWSTCRRSCASCVRPARAPTSGWPSTVTRIAASSSTRTATRCRRARSPHWSPSGSWPGNPASTILYNLISSATVPQVIAENGGVAVRTRVGHSFIKAEMARTGRGLRRRALGALLLRGLLPGRHRHAGRTARAGRAGIGRTRGHPAVRAGRRLRPVRRVRRDQLHGRRRAGQGGADPRLGGRRTAPPSTSSTASPSPAPTATGSTCARPTPNRCCGSTSRRPLPSGWRRCATSCWR